MSRGGHYILDAEHRPRPASLEEWARWFGAADRHVASTETELFWISTVFLGNDHQFGKGPPILFETMVFDRHSHLAPDRRGKMRPVRGDLDCWRYSSWDDAEAGHHAVVKRYLKKEADALAQLGKAKQRQKP
jgi:hypothetical protein